jgi:hypothetical protein
LNTLRALSFIPALPFWAPAPRSGWSRTSFK